MNGGLGAVLLPLLAACLALLLLFFLLPSPIITNRLLFFPDRSAAGPPPVLGGFPGREIVLETADGESITGWWYPADQGEPPTPGAAGASALGPAPAVVFLHGNAGHHGHRAFQAAGMLHHGVSVFLVGYRGYGGNSGRPDEKGVVRDGLAAFDWVRREVGGGERIVVHGRSLGGAVAAQVVAQLLAHDSTEEPLEAGPAGVILESTFTSLEAMAGAVYPVLPRILLRRLRGRLDTAEALRQAGAGRAGGAGRADGAGRAEAPGGAQAPGRGGAGEGAGGGGAPLPLLVIHGEDDELVPVAMGASLKALADTLPGLAAIPPLLVPGAGHNDLPSRLGDAYFQEVAAFVHRVTGR